MELNYRVNRTRVITFMPTNVFPLVIHQPNSAFPDLLTAITLRPGTIYELAMKQVSRPIARTEEMAENEDVLGSRSGKD